MDQEEDHILEGIDPIGGKRRDLNKIGDKKIDQIGKTIQKIIRKNIQKIIHNKFIVLDFFFFFFFLK